MTIEQLAKETSDRLREIIGKGDEVTLERAVARFIEEFQYCTQYQSHISIETIHRLGTLQIGHQWVADVCVSGYRKTLPFYGV